MSTFDKACPKCEATNSAAAVQCACGYVFNALYLEDPHLALAQAVREEQLIEEYLTARAEQAAEVAKQAVQAVLEEPEGESKLLVATRAQRAARAAKAELVEQRARAAGARLRAHIADVDDVKDSTVAQSCDAVRRPWQDIVVTEALKAGSVKATKVQPEEQASVVSSEQPSLAFRAAQVTKADKAVGASVRRLNLLPVKERPNKILSSSRSWK